MSGSHKGAARALSGLLSAALVFGVGTSRGAGTQLRLELVVSGASAPTYVAFAPGEPGRQYVVQKGGVVRVAEQGKLRRAPFLDIRREVSSLFERGLLSIAFDPRYSDNGFVYAAYSDRTGSLVVSRFHVQDGRAAATSERRLLRIARPPKRFHHYGGQLAFGPDGALYASSGDGGYPGYRCRRLGGRAGVRCGANENRPDPGHAQDPRTLFGKILRLQTNATSMRPAVVAYGLRNPWRFSFDRESGALYIGDVGSRHYEEVDYLEHPGGTLVNFGWSYYEGMRASLSARRR